MVTLASTPISPLFVPGSRPDRFAKAAASGADAVILDLEDSVAPSSKEDARTAVAKHAESLGCPVIVRINAPGTPWFQSDVETVRALPIAAIMLPKTERANDLADLSRKLDRQLAVIALIETAAGLERLPEILGAPNDLCVAFGSIDFALDIGCEHKRVALLGARSEIVWRSRAARKPAPLDGVTSRVDSPLAALNDARHSASLGFGGKLAIHPIQIKPIRKAFQPQSSTIDWAERVLAASVSGEAIRVDGEMVDGPVIERARRILSRASR
jgi:citrate lyase subunit beta/citryl-CoA lyase